MRLLLVILLALPAAAGCDNSSKTTNPDLKVPDVPAGGGRSVPKAK